MNQPTTTVWRGKYPAHRPPSKKGTVSRAGKDVKVEVGQFEGGQRRGEDAGGGQTMSLRLATLTDGEVPTPPLEWVYDSWGIRAFYVRPEQGQRSLGGGLRCIFCPLSGLRH